MRYGNDFHFDFSMSMCVSQNNAMVMLNCFLCFPQLPNDNGDDNEAVTGTRETRP